MNYEEKRAIYKKAIERFCNSSTLSDSEIEFGLFTASTCGWKTTFRNDLGYSAEQCYVIHQLLPLFMSKSIGVVESSYALGLTLKSDYEDSIKALKFWSEYFSDIVVSTEPIEEAPEPMIDKYQVVYFAVPPNK